jgi:flavin-binding protein dodecin
LEVASNRELTQVTVINTIELTGISAESWGDAARSALAEATRTIRNITKMDVLSTRAEVTDGAISEYHTEVRIFFEVER